MKKDLMFRESRMQKKSLHGPLFSLVSLSHAAVGEAPAVMFLQLLGEGESGKRRRGCGKEAVKYESY